MPAGAICAWCAQSLFDGLASGWPALLIGAEGGALAGIIVALMLDVVWRFVAEWVAGRCAAHS